MPRTNIFAAWCLASGATVSEGVFWSSIALLAYTFVGYPAAIWAYARLRPRALQKRSQFPAVTIVISAHNEEQHIARKLDSCFAQDYPADCIEVLIVSDGSTDKTVDIVRAYGNSKIQLLERKERRGKAACLNDALSVVGTEYVVFTDARQRLARSSVSALMASFSDEAVGAVSGELVFEGTETDSFASGVDAYWRYEKLIRAAEAHVDSMVGVTGALYAIRRTVYSPIPPGTILDDVLIPMNVVLQGKRVVFEPGARAFDIPSRDVSTEKRRKARTLAGNYQILALRPTLLNPLRNRLWLQYVSHKVLRLVAPGAMVTALAANVALAEESFYAALLSAQLVLYAVAFTGLLAPSLLRHRLVRFPATFCAFNWYAVLGLVQYLRNRHGHLWK